jgi:hypothetical protein
MSSGNIEYLMYNSLFGAYIESLPYKGVTFGGGPVNTAGSFSGQLAIQDPGVAKKNWQNSTKPNWNTLIIDIDGEIVWGGVVSGRKPSYSEQGFTLEIDATEGWGWFNYWVQATDYSSPPYSGITGPNNPNGMPIWNKPWIHDHSVGSTYINAEYGYQPYVWDPMLMAAQMIADKYTAEPNNGIWGGSLDIYCNGVRVCDFTQDWSTHNFCPWDTGDHGLAYVESTAFPGATDSGWVVTNAEMEAGVKINPDNYISITFPYTSLQLMNNTLSQLTALGWGIGFDAAVDFSYTAGKYSPIQATVNLSYPRRGAPIVLGESGPINLVTNCSIPAGVASNLVLHTGNSHDWTFPEDGTAQGNTEYYTGGNQDIVVVENIYTGGTPAEIGTGDFLYGGYVNTDKVTNIANLNSPNPTPLLQAMANSGLRLYSWPPAAPIITVDAFNPTNGLGTFNVGDDCVTWVPKHDQDGHIFDPRFPNGLPPTPWRIISYQANIADEGDSHVSLTMDTPPQQGTTFSSPILGGE